MNKTDWETLLQLIDAGTDLSILHKHVQDIYDDGYQTGYNEGRMDGQEIGQ